MCEVKMTQENKIKKVRIDKSDPRNIMLDSDEDCLVRIESIIGRFKAGGKGRSKDKRCR